MNEPETLPSHVHPEAALLPWYVNGTLSSTERQQLATHLEGCVVCRAELEELSSLQAGLTSIYDAEPGPSPQTARSVLAAVSTQVRAGRPRSASAESWFVRIDQGFRSLFMHQWVPTLAAIFLVVQGGLLLWIAPPEGEHITTRSLGMQTAKVAVVFHVSATEEQIRTLLHDLHGNLRSGPSREGVYVIEIPATDASVAENKVELLRKRTDVIRSAEILMP